MAMIELGSASDELATTNPFEELSGLGPPGGGPGGASEMSELMQTMEPSGSVFVDI